MIALAFSMTVNAQEKQMVMKVKVKGMPTPVKYIASSVESVTWEEQEVQIAEWTELSSDDDLWLQDIIDERCQFAHFCTIKTNATEEDMDVYSCARLNKEGSIIGYYDASTRTINIVTTAEFIKMPSTCDYMFAGCYNLLSISGIEHLDMSNVESMAYMFRGCESLNDLNLEGFDTAKVGSTESMFEDCVQLGTISVGEKFVLTKDTKRTDMFKNIASDINGPCVITGAPQETKRLFSLLQGGNEGYNLNIVFQ